MVSPVDYYSGHYLELYNHWVESYPDWKNQVKTYELIGVTVTRQSLPELFPRYGMKTHEWDDLWTILVVRSSNL